MENLIELTCKSTFGYFAWIAKVMVSQEVLLILAAKGLLQILQRTPASEAEKAIANALGLWGEKRPKDFERKDIPFTEESAKMLSDKLGAKHEIAVGVFITPELTVSYHPLGATAAPKFVDEIKIIKRHVEAGDFLDWIRDTVEYKGDIGHDMASHEENQPMLLAVKALKQKLYKTL